MKRKLRTLPEFHFEAQEAEWWFKNRDSHGKQLVATRKTGEAGTLTTAKLLERAAASKKTASPVVALRIPPYQTYIKSLLHKTVVKREKRSVK